MSLMVSESGIRGIAGKSLSADLVASCARAFARGRDTVLIGCDTRPSSPQLTAAAITGLVDAGVHVVDAGVVPTPTAQIVVQDRSLDGAIMITASHNPSEWNALKLIDDDGCFVAGSEVRRIYEIGSNEPFRAGSAPPPTGRVKKDPTCLGHHIDRIVSVIGIPRPRREPLRVAFDTSNGAAAEAVRLLGRALGCRVQILHDPQEPPFYHHPSSDLHFARLRRAVVSRQLNAGFGLDPDGDRLTLVDEEGVLHREDITLALAVDHWLTNEAGPVVVNDSTSRAVEAAARCHGSPVLRAAVGEANVVAAMRQHSAVIGGEGNGGVILPAVHLGRDALVASALVLALVAKRRKKLSELAAPFTVWKCRNREIRTSDPGVVDRLASELSGILPDAPSATGLKFESGAGWVTVRRSNTEPVIRVIAEAQDSEFLRQIDNIVDGAIAK